MEENNNNGKKINISLSPEVAEGTYSNMAVIAHSPSEFILDFVRTMPGAAPAVKSRIIMTPEHAKELFVALGNNIDNYEKKFGEIVSKQQPTSNVSFPFSLSGKGDA